MFGLRQKLALGFGGLLLILLSVSGLGIGVLIQHRGELDKFLDENFCLSSGGPNSAQLLRYGSRLAGRLNRNWYAVYVQTPSEEPTTIDARPSSDSASTSSGYSAHRRRRENSAEMGKKFHRPQLPR